MSSMQTEFFFKAVRHVSALTNKGWHWAMPILQINNIHTSSRVNIIHSGDKINYVVTVHSELSMVLNSPNLKAFIHLSPDTKTLFICLQNLMALLSIISEKLFYHVFTCIADTVRLLGFLIISVELKNEGPVKQKAFHYH